MTHRQALQGFPDTNEVLLNKINKANLSALQQFLLGTGK
jgi:hypothetical protein